MAWFTSVGYRCDPLLPYAVRCPRVLEVSFTRAALNDVTPRHGKTSIRVVEVCTMMTAPPDKKNLGDLPLFGELAKAPRSNRGGAVVDPWTLSYIVLSHTISL